jgi:hypothetical protein
MKGNSPEMKIASNKLAQNARQQPRRSVGARLRRTNFYWSDTKYSENVSLIKQICSTGYVEIKHNQDQDTRPLYYGVVPGANIKKA